MGRTLGAKCRLCRAEGLRLFLKGSRCESPKCPFSGGGEGPRKRMPSRPGARMGGRRKRQTEYGRQLREKQKLKRFYGVLEGQFKNYYDKATRAKGNAGVNLLVMFECRLDNVVRLSGLASSRSQARQLINHGHVFIGDRRVDIASYIVNQGEEITVRTKKDGIKQVLKDNLLLAKQMETPSWIDVSNVEKNCSFKITALPVREQISAPINVQLIVELCSK